VEFVAEMIFQNFFPRKIFIFPDIFGGKIFRGIFPGNNVQKIGPRLKSGWSIKTANLNQWKQPDPLSEDEHQKILDVITQAEMLEKAEQERVGYVMYSSI
jgi:hypothetical protein